MDKSLRILMVNYEYPPIGGGAGNANKYILKEMSQIDGIAIDLVTSFVGSGVEIEELSPTVKIHKVGINKQNLHHWRKAEVLQWLYRARGVYTKLRNENKYDLAHSFFAFPSGLFCWLSRKNLPYIISLRGSDVPGYNDTLGLEYFILSPLFKSVWKNASQVVANSRGLAQLASKFTPQLNIDVIPNGVALDEYSVEKPLKNTDGVFKLLTVGRLVNRKRIDQIIKALRLLLDKGMDVTLDIAGDGILAGQLKELATSIGVAERVSFLSVVNKAQMPAVYAASDAFIMCSEHEGMSNALLEAMAAGLPIITSDCEGIDELVADNGVVLENVTVQSVANAAEILYNDIALRDSMAAKSIERASMFSWRNVALAYVDRYRQVAQSRKVQE